MALFCGALLILVAAGVGARWRDVLLFAHEVRLRRSDAALREALLEPERSVARRAAVRVLERRVRRGRGGEFVASVLTTRNVLHAQVAGDGFLCMATGNANGTAWLYVCDRSGESSYSSASYGPSLAERVLRDLEGAQLVLPTSEGVPELVGRVSGARETRRIWPIARAGAGVGLPQGPACVWVVADHWERVTGTRELSLELLTDPSTWERLRAVAREAHADDERLTVR